MLWSLTYWLLRRLVSQLARSDDGERDLELAVLRYQIKVLSRQRSRRLRFRTMDRAVLAAAALFLPRKPWSCFLVCPDTLGRWHRQFIRRERARHGRKPGRPTAGCGDRRLGNAHRTGEPAVGLHAHPRRAEEDGDRSPATTIATLLRRAGSGPGLIHEYHGVAA